MRTASSDFRLPALVALALVGCLFISLGARKHDDSPADGRVAPGQSPADVDGKPALTKLDDTVKTKTPDVAGAQDQALVAGTQPKVLGNVRVAKGFKLDMLYMVPKRTQGSWVALCVDPKGRLIAADHRGRSLRSWLGKQRSMPRSSRLSSTSISPIPISRSTRPCSRSTHASLLRSHAVDERVHERVRQRQEAPQHVIRRAHTRRRRMIDRGTVLQILSGFRASPADVPCRHRDRRLGAGVAIFTADERAARARADGLGQTRAGCRRYLDRV